jgi:HlyD family secretion protein
MRRLITCILVTCLLVLPACQAQLPQLPVQLPGMGNATPAPEAPAQFSGFIEVSEVSIASEISAQIVAIDADEGQPVRAGQVVVRLDGTTVESQKAQAQAAVSAAQAVLLQTQAGPRPDAVAAAEAALERARAELAGATRAITDARVLVAQPPGLAAQIAQAQSQIKVAEQAVLEAKVVAQEAETLRDFSRVGTAERDIQEKKLEAAQARQAAADAQISGAVAYLSQLQRIKRFPAELTAGLHGAESRARVAAAQVELAQAALEALRAGAAPSEVDVANANVRTATANFDLAQAQLSHFTLSAPISGVVTRKLAHAGEVARAGSPLLVIADLSELKLVVYVPAAQVGKIVVGQQAEISVDAYAGVAFEGTVSKIASKAEFTPSNMQTQEGRDKLVFPVTIRIPNPDGRLKAGMPADVVFR